MADPIPGWTILGRYAGTYNPSTVAFPNGVPEGQNAAYIDLETDPTVTISQVLGSVLAPGPYTLEVDVGTRTDMALPIIYRIQLLAAGAVVAEDNNSLSPATGTFLTSTKSALVSTNHPQLGSPLEIRITATSPATAYQQLIIDNVRLDGPPRLTIRVSQVEICWDTATNAAYQLQYRSDLTTNLWTPFDASFFQGTGGNVCSNDTVFPSQPQRFYRVVTQPSP